MREEIKDIINKNLQELKTKQTNQQNINDKLFQKNIRIHTKSKIAEDMITYFPEQKKFAASRCS